MSANGLVGADPLWSGTFHDVSRSRPKKAMDAAVGCLTCIDALCVSCSLLGTRWGTTSRGWTHATEGALT